MASTVPEPGRRISLRCVRDDETAELVGFVRSIDPEGLWLQDRRGMAHRLAWDQLVVWRPVGVARGRDPLSASVAELALHAQAAGVRGRSFVARLSDLLDHRPPVPVTPLGTPPPTPALLRGSWVTAAAAGDPIELGWWAAHRDARSSA